MFVAYHLKNTIFNRYVLWYFPHNVVYTNLIKLSTCVSWDHFAYVPNKFPISKTINLTDRARKKKDAH